jgi:hypothetical protein
MNFKQIQNFLVKIFSTVAFIFVVCSVAVYADSNAAPDSCTHQNKSLTNLVSVTSNYPIIPASCSQNADGSARALSPEVLPDIAINAYYFLVSLGFTLIGPVFAVAGFLYYNAALAGQDPKDALSLLQNAGIAFLLLLFASVIPVTITQIFDIGGSTNLKDYFTFK